MKWIVGGEQATCDRGDTGTEREGNAVRALAVTTAQRSKALSDVPTIAEAGVPGYEAEQWWGALAPAKVPEP